MCYISHSCTSFLLSSLKQHIDAGTFLPSEMITCKSQIFSPSSAIRGDKLQQIASLTKQHFKLYCHIYYKVPGSLHFGILYNWFWQWLTWFGLLLFHPREIKHQNLCRCVMGQGFTICSAKSDFKDFKTKNTKVGIDSVIIYSFFAYFKELEFQCFNQHCYSTDFCNNLTNCTTNSPLALSFTQITYQGVDLRLNNRAT